MSANDTKFTKKKTNGERVTDWEPITPTDNAFSNASADEPNHTSAWQAALKKAQEELKRKSS